MASVVKTKSARNGKPDGKTKSAVIPIPKHPDDQDGYFVFLLDHNWQFYICLASGITQADARQVIGETECRPDQSIILSHGELDIEHTMENWTRVDSSISESGRREFS